MAVAIQGDVLVDEEYGDVFIPGQLLIGEAGDILQQGDGVAVLGGLNSLGQRVILLAVDLRGLIRLTDRLGKGRGIIASTIAKAKTVDNILFFMYVASS